MKVYCVDLDVRHPEVMEFSGAELEFDLHHYNVRDPMQLNDWDRRVFRTEADADAFLSRYMRTLRMLPETCSARYPMYPHMLYKRRYLVQSLMGDKLETCREYCKPWRAGREFILHDQTFFLPVVLTSLELTSDGYRYKFKLK